MAKYWTTKSEKVQCQLCPHQCLLPPTKAGICGVRENIDGQLETPYGNLSSAHVDPIEKKPLFHFHPSTYVYSIGGWGCNLKCKNCQNYQISQRSVVNSAVTTPQEICKKALLHRCRGVAFTYNEPTVWYEFMEDVAVEAHKRNLYTACISNGFIQPEPLQELLQYIDAFNIDVKAFSNRFYKETCGGLLDPVLQAVEQIVDNKTHVEVTYLIIPGLNDSEAELQEFINWVAELDKEIPVHFTAFHPDYQLNYIHNTPLETLLRARALGQQKGLKYVYLGNTNVPGAEDTVCPQCGQVAIKRSRFHTEKTEGFCPCCKADLKIIK